MNRTTILAKYKESYTWEIQGKETNLYIFGPLKLFPKPGEEYYLLVDSGKYIMEFVKRV